MRLPLPKDRPPGRRTPTSRPMAPRSTPRRTSVWPYELRRPKNGTFHAFEYLVSGMDNSTTTLTFVHSGYLGDDWDTEFGFGEMTGYGWDMCLHTLAEYLRHFAARPAHFVTAQGSPAAAGTDSWAILEKALGVEGPFEQGEQIRLTPQGLPVLGVSLTSPTSRPSISSLCVRPMACIASTTTRRWACRRLWATTSTPTSIVSHPTGLVRLARPDFRLIQSAASAQIRSAGDCPALVTVVQSSSCHPGILKSWLIHSLSA